MHNSTASTVRMFFSYVLLNYGIEVRELCRENALYSVKISVLTRNGAAEADAYPHAECLT